MAARLQFSEPDPEQERLEKAQKDAYAAAAKKGRFSINSAKPHVVAMDKILSEHGFYEYLAAYLSSRERMLKDLDLSVKSMNSPYEGLLPEKDIQAFIFWAVRTRSHKTGPTSPLGIFPYFKGDVARADTPQIITQHFAERYKNIRPRDFSPFSAAEAERLRQAIPDYRHAAYAMLVIQNGVKAFFRQFPAPDKADDSLHAKGLRRFQVVSGFNTFFGELLPHLLSAMLEYSEAPYSEPSFSAGLKGAFQKSALRSWQPKSSADSPTPGMDVTVCPFSSFIQDMWDKVYKVTEDGAVVATSENRSGAFPSFVVGLLMAIEKSGHSLESLTYYDDWLKYSPE